jgi:hypothetical protein
VKPIGQRIFSSVLLMALFGGLLGLIYGPDRPLLTAILSGALLGGLGPAPVKILIGLAVGVALGALFGALDPPPEPALVAARSRWSTASSPRSPTATGPSCA